jgi:tRNA threonylcarbamoyladenosine biosynthesis protein TsaE
MPESLINKEFHSEQALADFAAEVALCWQHSGCGRLVVALEGDLGSGKTCWVRAMLRGMGYRGRVPSPTYTLLEHYRVGDLDIVHMDLYRIQAGEELENLGVRDWLQSPRIWLLVEWPERAPLLRTRSDLLITLTILDATSRRVSLAALTEHGNRALRAYIEKDSNYGT